MRINTAIIGIADARRLTAAIQACGVAAPVTLTEVLQAHQRLSQAPPVADPTRTLVQAALDGNATPDTISKQLESTAITRLVVAERQGLLQRCEPALLEEWCKRLDNGAADAALQALRVPFDKAATTVRDALEAIDVLPASAEEFMASATSKQLAAWQSLPPAVAVLGRIAAVATAFGPRGTFPAVPDPIVKDPALQVGWMHDAAVMCTTGELRADSRAFHTPSPDLKSSPWLRVQPRLNTIAEAADRLRTLAESDWTSREAMRSDNSGRLLADGTLLRDTKTNPHLVSAS